MKTKQQSGQHKNASLLITLTVIVLVSCSHEVLAQQWSTSGNDIHNANSGNVGIGTTTPNEKLEINGNFRLPVTTSSIGIIKLGGDRLLHSFGTNNFFAGKNAGNFSLSGTENTAVGVQALSSISGQYHNTAFGFQALLSLNSGSYTQNTAVGAFSLAGLTSGGQNTAVGHGSLASTASGSFNTAIGNYALISATGSGNTQVGASTAFSAPNTTGSNNTYIGLNAGYTNNGANRVTTGSNNTFLGAFSGPGTAAQLTNATAIGYNALVSQSNSIVLGGTGADAVNVGIGTTTPAYKFDVAGAIRSSTGGFVFPDNTVQTTASAGTISGVTGGAGLTGSGTSGSVTLNIGQGTGVTVAADSVSVNFGSNAGTAAEGNKSVTVNAGSGMSGGGSITIGAGGTVTLDNSDRGSSQNIFKNVANVTGTTQFSAGSNSDAIRFAGTGGTTVSFDTGTKKITVDSSGITSSQWTTSGGNINYASGNVGIGTASPGAKLEVAGNVNVTGTGNITAAGTIEGGNIKAKYQDVAEWVESSQELTAGTLVVVDHTRSNQVIASTRAYDTRVAGVISAQPGIALGEPGDNKVLVATTGRVKVKVDASRGPIKIGDLLVTSDIPGVAMKSEAVNLGGVQIHRPGTIIGKALEPLAKGTDEILVLLSLQ